jgi:hypothetical protein
MAYLKLRLASTYKPPNRMSVGVTNIYFRSQGPGVRVDRPRGARHLTIATVVSGASDRDTLLRFTPEYRPQWLAER